MASLFQRFHLYRIFTRLGLAENHFTGHIPLSYGNLSSLALLSLKRNNLEGNIPTEFCSIPRLSFLQLYTNDLTGEVPFCLYNNSVIQFLSLANNQLEGSLPFNLGSKLPNIRELYLGSNIFTDHIPVSLLNASSLEVIDFFENNLTGSVPNDLVRLQNLTTLCIHRNQLGTEFGDDLDFINSFTNCSKLVKIEFSTNLLKGQLPESISNLSSNLVYFNAAGNQIYGTISAGIQNLINIESIHLGENFLTGNIPVSIGNLEKLIQLNLQQNLFSGNIPPSLGNLTQMTNLNLGGNSLSGTIPRTLGKCRNLLLLNLSHNKLIGTIPRQVISYSYAIHGLYLQFNFLTGSLPLQLGNLPNLVTLSVSHNNLSGVIPESIGYCLNLVNLFLDNNIFAGKIPQSMKNLKGLQNLDLSQNELSGEIPVYLESFPLTRLNLSFNQLEGQVPNKGVFLNASEISVAGNKGLCGGIAEMQLPPCIKRSEKSQFSTTVIISLVVGSVCLIVFICSFLVCCCRKTTEGYLPTMVDQPYRVSYRELHEATDGFSTENLIGSGSYASVFKGFLSKINTVVAVKVLRLYHEGAFKTFFTECKALRNLRHRNLVKLVTTCSSVDFQGNDFKALIFQFVPNGSLEEWLHRPRTDAMQLVPKSLSFIQRLNIAIDVASALEYLHHHFQTPIVHCDLKPSNVLLDDDMVGRVADFGIAKIFSETSSNTSEGETSSIVIKGSIGYMAPEYAMAEGVSTQGDVYSYGILLVDMFTGNKPTDDIFVDGLCLHSYAKIGLQNSVMQIVDPTMFLEDNIEVPTAVCETNARERLQESLRWMIRLRVVCSSESAAERVTMREVVHELHRIRNLHQSREVSELEVGLIGAIDILSWLNSC